MALKQILITRKISELEVQKKELLENIANTVQRRAEWKIREADAEQALEEIDENTSAEDKQAFDDEIAELEKIDKEIEIEETDNNSKLEEIETELTELKTKLDEINAKIENPEIAKKSDKKIEITEKREGISMRKYTPEYRARCAEISKNDEVKNFETDIRTCYRSGNTTFKITIPTVALPVLQERIDAYSKLAKYVNVQRLNGDGRQLIIGAAPEAVWTETTGKFNELSANLSLIEMSGNKIAGYISVPKPYMQDSELNLTELIFDLLGQAIALGIDKAIIYGTGENMPVGIVTRLLATTKPTWWDKNANAPSFVNLSTTNVGKISSTTLEGTAFMSELVRGLGKAKLKYNTANDSTFWVMNSTTKTNLIAKALSFNSAGALVTGVSNQMPVIGGAIETLSFMPDDVIVGGYGSHYTLAERHSVELRSSEHVKFIEDETVLAAVARYDGKPTAGEAFAAFSIGSKAVTGTDIIFAEDVANKPAVEENSSLI